MKLYKAQDRKLIYAHLWNYKKRREEVRKKYGVVNGNAAPEEYKNRVVNLNRKIRLWSKTLKVIDKRNNQLMAVANCLSYFSGINVKDSIKEDTPRHRLARNLFYKYCLENEIPATCVAEYVGATRGDTVARARLTFTGTIQKDEEKWQTWQNFKRYMQEQIENSGA